MTKKIDPELRDDRDEVATDVPQIELPEYDPSQFELPDDYEYVEVDEEGDENGDEDEA